MKTPTDPSRAQAKPAQYNFYNLAQLRPEGLPARESCCCLCVFATSEKWKAIGPMVRLYQSPMDRPIQLYAVKAFNWAESTPPTPSPKVQRRKRSRSKEIHGSPEHGVLIQVSNRHNPIRTSKVSLTAGSISRHTTR
jgi:hypothetical protein